MSFTAAFDDTRTTLDGTIVKFTDGDEVGVYVANASTPTLNAKGTVSHVEGKAVVTFTAAAFEAGDKIMAYYPYTADNNGVAADKAKITVPHNQSQAQADVLDGRNFPLVAVATAAETTEGTTVLFRPMASVMKLNVFSSDAKYQGAKILGASFWCTKWSNATSGDNWCVGYAPFDLTSVTETGDLSLVKNTIKVVATGDTTYQTHLFADGDITVSADKQSLYICLWPGNYGSDAEVSTKSYIYIFTDKGRFRFDMPDNADTGGYEFARATIRPFALDLAGESAKRSVLPTAEQLRRDSKVTGTAYDAYLADELIVIGSGSECSNIEKNPNKSWNISDTSINPKTAYAQTLDGKYGFRLVFTNVLDNKLHRGDKLKLNLYGAKVFKEENPDRYYIGNLLPKHIRNKEAGHESEIVSKERTIATLTDEDIYTCTTLTDMEFVVKDGPYTYTTETMTGGIRDQLATMMQDADNNAIYALINSECEWRRDSDTGKHVPQGVGKVNGIIVHTEDPAYGDMGKYQIRPIDEASFDIPAEEASATNVLARWSLTKETVSIGQYAWNGAAALGGFKQGNATTMQQNKMHATHGLTDGSAVLYTTNLTIINGATTGHPTIVGGTAGTMNNYSYQPSIINGTKGTTNLATTTTPVNGSNGKPTNINDMHGQSKSTALVFRHDVAGYYEWDESGNWTGKTNGIVIEFPATTATGTMAVSFTTSAMQVGTTNNANVSTKHMYKGLTHSFPLYWKVECSTDGGTTWELCTNTVNGTQEFEMRSSVNWLSAQALTNPVTGEAIKAYTPLAMPSGFIQEKFTLPASAAGAAKVMVKISPASLRLAWLSATYTDSIDTGVDCTSTLKYPSAFMLEDVVITY